MLRRFFLFGAMILTLGIGAMNATSVYATAEPVSAATTRPSQLELQSAIFRLEQLGDYQTHFGPNSSATLSNQVPHYQEYLYLYNLVTSTQNLVNHYHDTEYLTQHHISDTTFRDALIEMQHAYRGCFLLLGLANEQSTTTTHPATQATTSSPNSSNSAKAPANNTNQTTAKKPISANTTDKTAVKANAFTQPQKATPNSTNKASLATASTPAKATSATVATNVASNQADHTSSEITADEANTIINTNNATNTADAEVAVPNTGEATGTAGLATRRVSWPALLAVVITGALVASITIAVIVRHEPRRSNRARRRY